jgi:hypothetical protein
MGGESTRSDQAARTRQGADKEKYDHTVGRRRERREENEEVIPWRSSSGGAERRETERRKTVRKSRESAVTGSVERCGHRWRWWAWRWPRRRAWPICGRAAGGDGGVATGGPCGPELCSNLIQARDTEMDATKRLVRSVPT